MPVPPRPWARAAIAAVASLVPAQEPPPVPELVAAHCAECHTGRDAEGGFLVAAPFLHGDGEAARLAWQRVRARTMPPPDAPPLPAQARAALATALAAAVPESPGSRQPRLRRLARAEYAASVAALFGVPGPANAPLPEDAHAYGFDNLGDAAAVSPLVFEKYDTAAAVVADAVLDDPAAAARVFGPGEPLDAALARLLRRAFRRPPWPEELAARRQLHDGLRAAGQPERAARAAVLRSVLASPAFLFRSELGRPEAPARLSDHELATRLSFLLTGGPPDDELLAAADAGRLGAPAALPAAAARLLAQHGGRPLAERFAAQWLGFGEVLQANADFRRYPQIWNARLRPSLYEEAVRLFAAVVAEDLSVLRLLDADFTFLDATLAQHYGFGAVAGDGFERVAVPDRRRGGVLGLGAVLLTTSHPLRTSPVLRGRWILDRLLDLPPPPPPPGTPALPADDAPVAGQSLRQRLERHRRQRSCAGCHAAIDPLGFALENFDVVGRWRDELHGQPVDARGELPDGTVLDGPVALRDELLRRHDDFVRAMAARLTVFAIGRALQPQDEPELQRLVAAAAAGDHRFGALLQALLASPLFTHRWPEGS